MVEESEARSIPKHVYTFLLKRDLRSSRIVLTALHEGVISCGFLEENGLTSSSKFVI
jgi:hypothetical protein